MIHSTPRKPVGLRHPPASGKQGSEAVKSTPSKSPFRGSFGNQFKKPRPLKLDSPRVTSPLGEDRPKKSSLCDLRALNNSIRKKLKDLGQPQAWTRAQLLQLGLSDSVISMTSQSARDFIFTNQTCPVFNDKKFIGPTDMFEALVKLGANPNVLQKDWVLNHYRWIVWKLAALERSFPHELGTEYLTPARVLWQLQYRYEREANETHRSAIKQILERDEIPSRYMVLFVASLRSNECSAETQMEPQVTSLGNLILFRFVQSLS